MAESHNFETSRKVAQITLSRVRNWEDLNALTITGGNFKFVEKSQELWKEFAVHGIFGTNKEGEKTILNVTDLDGKSALGLLRLAGMDTKDVKYIKPSKSLPDRINLDTGDKNGIVIEDGGKTVFFDHHTNDAGQDTSATKLVYEGLTSVGLLEKTDYLDKLVDFVTQIDNGKAEGPFHESYRTILGLQRFLPFEKLLAFFKAGRKSDEILGTSDLGWLGLKEKSEQQKRLVENSDKKLDELESDGFVFDTEKYGKVVIDIGKKIPAGFDAVRARGYQTYLIWNPEENSFFLSSKNNLEISLPQGIMVREKMWIKPRHDEEPLKVKLEDIIVQLAGEKFNATGKLKNYLEGTS